MPERRLLKT